MKQFFLFVWMIVLATGCSKDNTVEEEDTIPQPGTTKQFTVDITTLTGKTVNITLENPYATVCQQGDYAAFDMDNNAVSYTVKFHGMKRQGQGLPPTDYADFTYKFLHNAGVELKNGQEGNYIYTNVYSIGNPGAVTRNTSAKKLFVNAGWCAGQGVCKPDPCYYITGKATVTVQY